MSSSKSNLDKGITVLCVGTCMACVVAIIVKFTIDFNVFRYYVKLCIAHVLSTPTLLQLALCTLTTFVAVYRWGVPRWIRLNYPKLGAYKVLKCETCFSFWLCLLISTNLTTAAAAYLLYNFYERN